jgi:hypothetical protein
VTTDDVRDDEAWLDALAGRAGGDSAAAREAHELRSAMLAREVRAVAVAEIDPAREQMLLARARRTGLSGARFNGTPGIRLSLAAAAVACIALGFWFVQRPHDETFVVRSQMDGTIHIETHDPRALKQRLLAELRAAGVAANGYQRLGTEGIDADLPPVLNDRVAGVLDHYGLAPPTDGVLRVEIAAPPDQ